MQHERPARPLLRVFGDTTVVLFLLTFAYYLLPRRFDLNQEWALVRLAVSLAALGLLAVLVRGHVRRSRASRDRRLFLVQWLLTALYGLILGFALAYSALETFLPGQFVGIEDRTDALYFTVTIVATVGFGDIHPVGTVGQLATTAHMVFNVIYLGTAVRVLTSSPAAQQLASEPPKGQPGDGVR